MSFLCLFDLLDFDKDGAVCETKTVSLEQARSNYLYLLSKYNQAFLKEQSLEIPSFFKQELEAVLKDVENGGNFKQAKKNILSNCIPKVQAFANVAQDDRELVLKLNDNVSVKDEKFASKFQKAVNNLQLSYIITMISGQLFDSIVAKQMSQQDGDKKIKSEIYKDMIKYNSLVLTADKVKQQKISVADFYALA